MREPDHDTCQKEREMGGRWKEMEGDGKRWRDGRWN
jgi:hypothetical protein